jgi:hypothetical protein
MLPGWGSQWTKPHVNVMAELREMAMSMMRLRGIERASIAAVSLSLQGSVLSVCKRAWFAGS